MQPLQRVIATLEAEATMMESHADKLLRENSTSMDEEQRRQLLPLAEEELAAARTIRLQIRLLRDHLDEDSEGTN